ncbi:ankyrin [Fusarium mexicanum]|uniref:Ankyrin n=1 Tax=Fusarium mexicanum TaxID=751941 RepID=A0A8H5JDJ1_9HYPO|nr:ankyrin [Fusarium mexicanum]
MGFSRSLVSVVERSLDQGADVNYIINHDDETALFPAVRKQHWDIVHLLLARGADVHRRNRVGDNLVYFAVTTGSYDLVKLMLDQGVDPNSHVEGDVPPLLLAVRRGYLDIVRLLFDGGAYIDDSDDWGETPLHIAVGTPQHDILSFFIEKDVFRKDKTGARGADALEMAVIRGDMSTLRLLLEGGADPLVRRWTRHHAIITAALAREDDMAILMTERLVGEVGSLDEHGKELLWYAVKGRCQRYTRYLLNRGLDPDRDLWKEVDGSMVGGSALVVEMLGAGVLTA